MSQWGYILKCSFGTLARAAAFFFTVTCATSVYAQGNTQPENPPATDPQASPSTSPPEKPPQILSPVVPAPREVQPGPASSDKKDQTTDPSTTHDRLFFALPNFLAIDSTAHVAPLTAGQKFKVAVRSSFDYVQYPWYAVLAGISQAQNSEPSYGQGAEGYAKRYATAFADGTIENFMVNAVVPSVLRTDPRYYQLGAGSFVRRTSYALSRLFITRTDSGHNTFNFAEIGGSGMGAAISTYSYHPAADKTFSNTGSVWGTQVAYDAIRIVLNEFWPDIRRKFTKIKVPVPESPK
jgi:hypothetical protein